MSKTREQLLKIAFILSIITIIYNLFEGGVSVFFGAGDDSLTLLGFGVDSFVEVISGIGIAHMLIRMKNSTEITRDDFEKQALKITGFSFYLLTAGLIIGAIVNVIEQVNPSTTIPGMVISIISILTMYFLMNAKLKVGGELNSEAIIADAKCTKTCLQLSIILLAASLLYQLLHILYIDIIGSVGIAYLSFREGKESFEKAKKGSFDCCDDD
ncbi:MAG: cation transporter [Ignavibacteriaceae bacterium]|jgi:cytochrome c biogenesis factor